MTDTRHIRQTFHRTSGLELRSTWQSTQAYKRHSHPQLSIGAIVEGQTCCVCHDREYILNPGDLIAIPAGVPHSCNPVAGQPRSYHMLYIDTGLPLALQVIRSPTLFAHYLDVVETLSPASLETLLSALPRAADNADALRATSQQIQQAFLSDLTCPPSLDELAQRFSLRKETLIRTFRQDTGLTPGSFLNISRVCAPGMILPTSATRAALPTRAIFIRPSSAIPPPRRASTPPADQYQTINRLCSAVL